MLTSNFKIKDESNILLLTMVRILTVTLIEEHKYPPIILAKKYIWYADNIQ